MMALHFDGEMPRAYDDKAAGFYRRRWPVGARDPSTRDAIQARTGASVAWNGDLTWTLKPLCARDGRGRIVSAGSGTGGGGGGGGGGVMSSSNNGSGAEYVIVDVDEAVLRRFVPRRIIDKATYCLLYTSPSPRDATLSRMPSSA